MNSIPLNRVQDSHAGVDSELAIGERIGKRERCLFCMTDDDTNRPFVFCHKPPALPTVHVV